MNKRVNLLSLTFLAVLSLFLITAKSVNAQMMGFSNSSIDNTAITRQQGEEQMHIAWGERGSGCNTNASLPFGMMTGSAFSPESFGGTRGGGSPMMGYGDWNNMMGGWGGFGFGWIFMIIFWILIILGVVALVRYLATGYNTKSENKTPVEILKERYAKGEVTKREFEEMKKDLV